MINADGVLWVCMEECHLFPEWTPASSQNLLNTFISVLLLLNVHAEPDGGATTTNTDCEGLNEG